nr:immunoglobulin heavy chain junction region [Mus musculus]
LLCKIEGWLLQL